MQWISNLVEKVKEALSGILVVTPLETPSQPIDSILEGIVPSLVVFIGAMIVLGIITYLISKFAYFPAKEYVTKRKQYFDNALDEKRKKESEINDLYNQTKRKYDLTEIEIEKMMEEGKSEALLEKEKIITLAQEEISRKIIENEKFIENERIKMENEMKEKITSISIDVAEKILQENMNTKSNNDLIEQFLKDNLKK